jgi:hypothetical protein
MVPNRVPRLFHRNRASTFAVPVGDATAFFRPGSAPSNLSNVGVTPSSYQPRAPFPFG